MTSSWSKAKAFFTRNAGMKGLAILLATVTFYAIRGATGFEIHYDVPLEILVEPGIAILEKETPKVRVTFRGAPEDLSRLEQQRLKAVVRPKDVTLTGPQAVEILPRHIEGAPGASIQKIKPNSVLVTFDREVQKEVLIEKPITQGTPLIGRAELDYTPKVVTLRGSQFRLRELASVGTEPVDVDGRVESFSKTVRVLAPSDKWVMQVDPEEIEVAVTIVTELVTMVLSNKTVLAIMEPGSETGVPFDPPHVTVTLEGRPDIIDDIDPQQVQVFASCLDLDPTSTNPIPVMAHFPHAADVTVRLEPDHVTLGSEEAP